MTSVTAILPDPAPGKRSVSLADLVPVARGGHS